MIDIQVLYLFLGGFTIFAFLIGAAAGWWLGVRFGSKSKDQPVEKPVITEPQKDSSQRDATEILRFIREQGGGALVMEMRGKVYRKAQELTDVERKNLARFGQDWLKWLGVPAPQPIAMVDNNEPVQKESEAELQSASSELGEQPLPRTAESAARQGRARPATPAAPVEDVVAPTSIVAQIDEILQELIPLSPLADRNIKLTEDPNQGVAVWVDNQCFLGVDGVPDPDVRALLRKAAQEWEKRSG